MAVLGVLATALSPGTAKGFGIFLDGFDVSGEPATPSRYGVPRESIEVTETGRWGVSSMSFDIDDTALVVNVVDGMEVRFELFFPSVATIAFRGWVDHYSIRPAFGDQGRTISITATGAEALLDWALIPLDMSFPTGAKVGPCIQSLVANSIGSGPLLALASATGQSTTDGGISQFVNVTTGLVDAVTISAGTSLGEAIRQVIASSDYAPLADLINFTVDFNFSLRAYEVSQVAGVITNHRSDASLITLTDSPGAAQPGENVTYDVTAASQRGVFVKGFNAAGTGTLMDGTGRVGPIAYVSDDTSDSAISLQTIATDYLRRATTGLNGHFALTNITPATYVQPDGILTVTDARLGLAATQFYIGPITRHWPGAALVDMEVSFGGPPPSGAALLRQLTRTQRL